MRISPDQYDAESFHIRLTFQELKNVRDGLVCDETMKNSPWSRWTVGAIDDALGARREYQQRWWGDRR